MTMKRFSVKTPFGTEQVDADSSAVQMGMLMFFRHIPRPITPDNPNTFEAVPFLFYAPQQWERVWDTAHELLLPNGKHSTLTVQ